MGQKLLQMYEKAKQLGGIKGQMRLAVLTKTPSSKAEGEPDSSENIAKFEEAMRELAKEFSK
jgi:hypothetical protein